MLRELADSVTATRSGGRVTIEWKFTVCATVRQKGDYAELTARPGAMWSGIYYIDDGYAKSDDETLGGECELADPRGALPRDDRAASGLPHSRRHDGGFVETIRPADGHDHLHPSWQPRGERRFDGASQRVAIEFDLAPP